MTADPYHYETALLDTICDLTAEIARLNVKIEARDTEMASLREHVTLWSGSCCPCDDEECPR